MVSVIYAHTYISVYADTMGNTVGVSSNDYSDYISISVNCSLSSDFYFQENDDCGNMYYRNDPYIVSISLDRQTFIIGNIYTGQTIIFKLRKITQIN